MYVVHKASFFIKIYPIIYKYQTERESVDINAISFFIRTEMSYLMLGQECLDLDGVIADGLTGVQVVSCFIKPAGQV